MPRRTLVSLGSVNADFQVRVDAPAGSQETLLAHQFRRFAGGKAGNAAFLGARFGHRSLLLGRVGDDALAEQALAPLRDAGVEVAVESVPGRSTGVSMITVPPDAKKHIVLATNANDDWAVPGIEAMAGVFDGITGPACLVVNYEVPAIVVRRAVQMACRQGWSVVLDPSFPDRVERDLLPSLTAIVPNVAEAEALVGFAVASLDDAARAALALQSEGVSIACVKLSDGGCVLAGDAGLWHLPGGHLKPVDTTGAGDGFTGAMAIALLEGRPPLEAAAWGVATAQHAVTAYGSQAAYPDRARVEASAGELLDRAVPLERPAC
ncbi:PfkB family carbohydrate kinase [Stutzerimonas tarimensis]|uniref:PfkB family carbohydrate kinase n=1 Tax=Stutzerimonas tarimensis TaxID=1507735 RepID=A0ABV7T7Q7_9GAMM